MDTRRGISRILDNKHMASRHISHKDTCMDVNDTLNNNCMDGAHTLGRDIGKGVNRKLDNTHRDIGHTWSTDRPLLGRCSNSGPGGLSQPRRQQRYHLAGAAA